MITILGVDPSLTNTGIVVVRDGAVVLETLIQSEPDMLRPDRLLKLDDEFSALLKKWDPALVAMEAEIWTSSQAQSSDQGAVQAVYQMLIREYNLRFLSVNVSHVKKYVGAKEKDQVLLQVYKRYKREIMDHNIADAFVIAQIGLDFLHYEQAGTLWPELTKPQTEVLDTLLESGLVWEHPPARGKKAKKERRQKRRERQKAADPRLKD